MHAHTHIFSQQLSWKNKQGGKLISVWEHFHRKTNATVKVNYPLLLSLFVLALYFTAINTTGCVVRGWFAAGDHVSAMWEKPKTNKSSD